MCNTHTRYRLWHLSIVDAPSRAVAYNIAKMQSSKIDVALLPVYTFFGMEVWNGIRKKILVWNEIWKEDFWYGMEMEWNKIASMEYGKIVFHSIPCHALSTTQVK